MFRRVLVSVLRLALRVFFRRIEVSGAERVPRGGACVFVLNHPNALVDPVFILCHAPRRVSFLAKEPLFRMPVIGSLVRAMDAIPVYRKQDEGADTARNRETFVRARALLRRGGSIAICPEGTSHSDTKLRPLKTGAARIALGVAAEDPQLDLKIVPAGLYYTAKTAFRSAALLHFGEPLKVEPVPLDDTGEPPHEAVRALSSRIERALHDVTLNAEHEHALATISRAEQIFSEESEMTGAPGSLARELELRRRFLEGYAFHFAHNPARLAALDARLSRYEETLRLAGLDPEDLSAPQATQRAILRHLTTRVLPVLCLAPLAFVGVVAHYATYRLAGLLATRFARESDDVISTIKIIAAMLLFPLTWLVHAVFLGWLLGWWGVAVALTVVPACGWVAVRFFEELDGFVGGARALRYYFTRRWFFKELLAERRRLREEMTALGEEAAREGAPTALVSNEPTRHTI
ncbi:MAG: glycerol-3-phosphate O-acyltransferase / dihydroxyacetone phosphate acyltransferase [Acidobacteriota bacterium]|jgi:1-acyl-sn-glycerol-3-phosphate acyltransferase|nr:glycerol-3-phosphate O-acyltransferase / dihydroxyacetone phosphate acyltransferase [Acidobacteriota bacterium]